MITIEQRAQITTLLRNRSDLLSQQAEMGSALGFQIATDQIRSLEKHRNEFKTAKDLLFSMGAEPLSSIENLGSYEMFATYSTLNGSIYCFNINPDSPFREIRHTVWTMPKEQAVQQAPEEQRTFWGSLPGPTVYGAKYSQEAIPWSWASYISPASESGFLTAFFHPTSHYGWQKVNDGLRTTTVWGGIHDDHVVDWMSFATDNAFGFKKTPRYLKDGFYVVDQMYRARGIDLEITPLATHHYYKTGVPTIRLKIDVRQGERQFKGKFEAIIDSREYGARERT